MAAAAYRRHGLELQGGLRPELVEGSATANMSVPRFTPTSRRSQTGRHTPSRRSPIWQARHLARACPGLDPGSIGPGLTCWYWKTCGTSRREGAGRSRAISTGVCRTGSTGPLSSASGSIAKNTGLWSASRIRGRRRNVAMRASGGTGETDRETGSVAYRAVMRTMSTSTQRGICAPWKWSEPMVSASSKAAALSDKTRLLLTISSSGGLPPSGVLRQS